MKVDSLKILELQTARGMKGYQLAEAAGINPGSLSAIKTRETTTPMMARRIARALGVDLEAILKKEEA